MGIKFQLDEAEQILTYFGMSFGDGMEEAYSGILSRDNATVGLSDAVLREALNQMKADEPLTDPRQDLPWTYGIMERLCHYFGEPCPKMQNIPLRPMDCLTLEQRLRRGFDPIKENENFYESVDKQNLRNGLRLIVNNDPPEGEGGIN